MIIIEKEQVRNRILKYLKYYNIPHTIFNCVDKPVVIENMDTIHLVLSAGDIPGGIEMDVHLYSEIMEIKAFFSEMWVEDLSVCPDLAMTINYINAKVWDSIYYGTRLFFDGTDIVLTTIIDYRCFETEKCQDEIINYITIYPADWFAKWGTPLIMVAQGEVDYGQAKYYIDNQILKEGK